METPKEILQKVKSFAGREATDYQLVKTKASVHAAIIGMVAGAMIGHYKGYNVYLSSLVAGAACVMGVAIFIKNPEADPEE